jgi:hypothetical protein
MITAIFQDIPRSWLALRVAVETANVLSSQPMNFQTRLCNFTTSDHERLHGLLFTPPEIRSELALLFVHGVAMNFYLPPLCGFGQELAERGFHSFVING